MLIIDGHLDLAINALALNRNLQLPVHLIREKEKQLGWTDTQDRGKGTVAIPELKKARVGIVLATIIARYDECGNKLPTLPLTGWHSPEQAYAYAQGQLAWYRLMEERGLMKQIHTKLQLDNWVALWKDETISTHKKPIGFILSLEGADSIVDLSYLDEYYAEGLRAIGPAHFGPGRYAAGTHSDGSGITKIGKALLKKMASLRMALDATHLTDKGFFEAMKYFDGTVWASHQNCRKIVAGERQFSDEQLKLIIERGGVIGGALDTWMLHPNFQMGVDFPRTLKIGMDKLIDHFDHICQLAGNTDHIAFGTDLDGLFGTEQTPYDMDTIADLPKYKKRLRRRGYSDEDLEKIFHGNWLRMFRKVLP
jgi:membrane dipeptidase